jgi:apolipoprotein D and lipocalin family protein
MAGKGGKMKSYLKRGLVGICIALIAGTFAGCPAMGPRPETVPFVDLDRYVGLWYEIASNPVFFNQNLVGVTAEYTKRSDGRIKVVNTGFEGSLDGPKDQVEGVARVVDTQTNSKLGVKFDIPFGRFFEGEYWIVLLDDENYEYAVVTDSRQYTLFVLYREPEIPQALLDQILAELEAKNIDLSRLELTGGVVE